MDPMATAPRERSTSPTGMPSSSILEWNFLASRLNEIIDVLRDGAADFRLDDLAVGLQIELVRLLTGKESQGLTFGIDRHRQL